MDPQPAAALLLNRRELLLALGAVATLSACSSASTPGVAPPVSTPTNLDKYRLLRDLIRTSPDHLAARAARVIASKDLSAAVRFVRDQIAVVPPSHATDSATDAVRWGPDAALRAGAGTQRERAELLKAMLLAMGATAKVVSADRPPAIDAAALYTVRPPTFSIDSAALETLGADVAAKAAHINEPFPDPDPGAVVSSLLALIPSAQAVAADPFDGLDSRVPVVEYAANGVTKWAFALGAVDEVTTSPAGLGSELSPAAYPAVSVRLLAAMGDVPGVPTPAGLVELVAGTWTAAELAGSRLLITTASANPTATAGAPSDQVTIRTPLMQVQRSTPLTGTGDPALFSPSTGSAAPKPAGGGPFTLSGAVIPVPAQASDPVVGPYGAFSKLDAVAHAAALASVASVQAVANGGAFPGVQLTVAALDAGGNPVAGLVQSDFAITDDGAAQTATLVSNAGVDQIKVMLAYDCSGSVAWPAPADKTAFDTQLAGALVASAASHPFLLGVAPLGSRPADGYVAPDATAIQNGVASCLSFSPLWATLGSLVPGDGVSVVVMVSDFQGDDDPATIAALQKRAVASGVALALVPVSAPDQPTIDALVQTFGAVVLDHTAADFQQKLTDFVSGATTRAKKSGYRFAYRLPDDQQTNQGTRTATVSLASRSAVAASAPYAVPAAGSRGNMGVAGLYVELRIGTSATVTRRLSGPALDRFGNPTAAVSSDFDDTRAMLNGIISVAFEPGSPTAAQNAEDLISAVLSLDPLKAAVGKTQSDALTAASTARLYAAPLSMLVDPPAAAATSPVVAPEWMRVVVTTESVGQRGLVYTTDIVPELNRSVAATTDAAASFQSVLRAGVALSLRESQALRTSAASSLSGAPLQYLAPSANPTTLTGFAAADLAKWQRVFDQYNASHLLVPTNPAVGAMWVVDPRTGSTVAVFLDGSGAGSTECNNAVNNTYWQVAIALLQAGIAMILMKCEPIGGAFGPFPCAGAYVFGVGASVVALFAGGIYEQNIAPDALITGEAFVFGLLPGVGGVYVSLIVVMLVLIESFESISESCG